MKSAHFGTLAFIWCFALGLARCSGPQTDPASSKTLNTAASQVVEPGIATQLVIEGGALAGAEISMPAGSIPDGSKLSVVEATTPTRFGQSSAVTRASNSASITASDADSNQVSELAQPMTIQLPVLATNLRLAVETVEANLCVFLEGVEGSYFVWRRESISFNNALVTFESKKFGIYQVVYCGTEALDGFLDVGLNDIPVATTSLGKIIVPGSAAPGFDFGQSHICLGYVANGQVIGMGDAAFTSGTDSQVEAFLANGSTIPVAGSEIEVWLLFQASDQPCSLEAFTAGPEFQPSLVRMMFRRAAELLADGSSSTLGDITGNYGLHYTNLEIGRSDNVTTASSTDMDVCLLTYSEGSTGGMVEIITHAKPDNTIGGHSVYSLPFVSSSDGSSSTFEFFTNSQDCQENQAGASANTTINQVTLSVFRDVVFDTHLYLLPVNIGLAGVGELGYGLYKRLCLRAYQVDPGPLANENDKQEFALTSILMDIKLSANFQIFLPHLSSDIYYFGYKGLSTLEEDCQTDVVENIEYVQANENMAVDPATQAGVSIP